MERTTQRFRTFGFVLVAVSFVAGCSQSSYHAREASTGIERVKHGALENYEAAQQTCTSLNACNPIRLGLALNFSVFHYEVMNNHKKACELGEQALTEALEKIDDVDEETFRDAKSIIELLKENLSLWKEEEDQNAVEDL